MNNDNNLLWIVTYAIVFLFIFLVIIIIFIIKSNKDKINIQNQKREIEEIANQKTVLLKEIHHRVKNNLQLISGLLYLQSVKHKNEEITTMVNDSQKHINSIALIHEMLYRDETMSLVSMKEYLQELGTRLLQVSTKKNIDYQIHIKNISLSTNYATTLGLMFNEMVTNSLKYAFVKGKRGVISVSLTELNTNEYQFIYADNGIGFEIDTLKSDNTMGQKLIRMFAEEIEASLEIKNENGLSYIFNFKKNND